MPIMASSFRDHASFIRPGTRERPSTRDLGEHNLMIPSRTSSLHSRITQPIPSTLTLKPSQRTPKTLTHAYMVCGVGREPSQWVKAPAPSQGKIVHMKGAVGQFWLPEILGSSPRLEQDNEVARSLHAAMRVSSFSRAHLSTFSFRVSLLADIVRRAFLTMWKYARAEVNRIAYIIPSFCSRTRHILYMALLYEYGRGQTSDVQRQSETFDGGQSPISSKAQKKPTGFHIA